MSIVERMHELRERREQKVLVLDIETSPHLAWTFKTWQANISQDMIVQPSRILCFAATWAGSGKMLFHSEWDDGHDGMVEAAWRLLDEADILVTYNGPGFDEKHLQREFFTAGFGPPSPWQSVDLLKIVRQRFKFPSNRLGNIGDSLDIGTKLKTDGWPLWQAVLEGDEKAQRTFARYCKQDVRLTEDLLTILGPWVKGLPHAGMWTANPACCPACGGTDLHPAGISYAKVNKYLRCRCQDCGAWCRIMRDGSTRPA